MNKLSQILPICLILFLVLPGTGSGQEASLNNNTGLTSFVIGGTGGATWSSSSFLVPAEISNFYRLNINWGLRQPLTDSGYISADISGDGYVFNHSLIQDNEQLSLTSVFPVYHNKMEMGIQFSSSLMGFNDLAGFIYPQWTGKYRFLLGAEPDMNTVFEQPELWLAYEGYLFYQPNGEEDSIFEGARLGFSHAPAIDFEYTVSLGGGWRLWNDTFLYDAAAGLTENKRSDWTADVQSELSGLWGFYTAWNLSGQVQYVHSNANRYIATASLLNQHSEDKLALTLSSELIWNPVRNIELNLTLTGQPQFYLFREALDGSGQLLNDKLWVVYLGSEARLDWTPDNHFYLVLEGEGGINLSNELKQKSWFIKINGGVEVSF